MNSALGLIETQGLVGLIYAIDAMLKSASVELASSIIKLDGGLVSVMVRGDVSSVRAAIEAGAEAASRVGELKAAHVIPRPGDVDRLDVSAGWPLMKILVANLGSTSFKYRLYDLDGGEHLLARGGIERIGSENAKVKIHQAGRRRRPRPSARSSTTATPCRSAWTSSPTPRPASLKTPPRCRRSVSRRFTPRMSPASQGRDRRCAGGDGGVRRRRPRAQPAVHEAAMRMLGGRFPSIPLVAAFETGFHRTIPEANQRYAIPDEWATKHGDPPLGLPRREPPLHRRTDGRIARSRRPQG